MGLIRNEIERTFCAYGLRYCYPYKKVHDRNRLMRVVQWGCHAKIAHTDCQLAMN